MQPTVVAFVWLQTLPQAPQFVVVVSGVHVPLQRVSRQVHEPSEQSGLGCAHVASSVQVPALHVCGVSPLHVVWPGAHCPEQRPPMHVVLEVVHTIGFPHAPPAAHE